MVNIYNQAIVNELKDLVTRYPALESISESYLHACEILLATLKGGNKLLLCGNGGSAADCEHIAGELLKGFLGRRKISSEIYAALEKNLGPNEAALFAENLQMAIPAISLTSHNSFTTAFGNDMNYQFAFAQHLLGLGKSGDSLIAISTSGNSKNIILAVKLAKSLGIKVIGLTGESGGALKDLCDVTIKAPAKAVHHIQELHLPIYHSLCLSLERSFFKD